MAETHSFLERAKEGLHHAKEEIGSVLHRDHSSKHIPDVEVKPAESFKERAKELKEEIGEALHSPSHHHHLHHQPDSKLKSVVSDSGDAVKNLFERTKKELEEIMEKHKPHHRNSIFERAKDEMEELAHSIHPKKKRHHFKLFEREEEGCMAKIGKWFENICARKRD